jgi:hypothetical protein
MPPSIILRLKIMPGIVLALFSAHCLLRRAVTRPEAAFEGRRSWSATMWDGLVLHAVALLMMASSFPASWTATTMFVPD